MKKYILISMIALSACLTACGGNKEQGNDSSNTVVADSTGNAGSGQGAPTEGAVSGGHAGSTTQDSTATQQSTPGTDSTQKQR